MGLLAYDRSGTVLVRNDGAEVVAWRNPSEAPPGKAEAPAWRRALTAPVVALATAPGEVLALDEQGGLTRLAPEDGAVAGRAELGRDAAPLAISAARDGTVALLDARGLRVFEGGRLRSETALEGGRAVALSDDGARAVVVTGSGLTVVETAAGAALATNLLDAAQAVAWSPRGDFFVGVGRELVRFDADGGSRRALYEAAAPIAWIAVAADGLFVACATASDVAVVDLVPRKEPLASFHAEAGLKGLAFGPETHLGLGLPGGEGLHVQLSTGREHHLGGSPTPVTRQLDPEQIRKSRATAGSSADAVAHKLAAKEAAAARAAATTGGRSPALLWIVLAVLIALGVGAWIAFLR